MKTKTHARILAAILSFVMMLTALPITGFASDFESDGTVQDPASVEMRIDSTAIDSEDNARRSEDEKHFEMDDGTYLAVKYGVPVHRLSESGEWEDIGLSFYEEENDSATTFVSKTDALYSAISDGTAVHLTTGEDASPVDMKLTGFDMTASEKSVEEAEYDPDDEAVYRENIRIIEEAVKSSALNFADASQGVGLAYERSYSGIRQSIVIDHEIENNSFSFELDTGDLTAALNDGGNVEIRDGDEVKYIIPAPYMHDSENKHFALLSYSLEEAEIGEYILTINSDDELTDNEDISYPVTISTAVTVPYERAVSMTSVSSDAPDMSYTGENIQIGKDFEGNTVRAFFNTEELPALADDDVMLTAQLHTYHYCLDSEDASVIPKAYPVTERWDADSITWNYQPIYSDEEKEYKAHYKDGIFAPAEWDITKEVFDSYEGDPSHGIAFTSSDETKSGIVYFPVAYDGEFSPYLLVNYLSISQYIPEDTSYPSDSIEGGDPSQAVSGEAITEDIIPDATINTEPESAAASYAASAKTFKEITGELKIEYCTTSKDVWTTLPSGKGVANLCGVRISTNNSKYYLKYRSKNKDDGKDWLGYVFSTKSGEDEYAGLPNCPMTNLSIAVYTSDGTRIFDDYVVMYRAKVAGEWLEWVSNGQPDIMQTLKSEYSLSGDLDTSHTDAGWEALGNIQALEIRMFERINGNSGSSGGSSAPVEAGDFQLASGITMKYHETGSDKWTAFGVSDTVSFSSIDGIILEAPGKPYYFRYAAKDATTGWNPYVSSRDANENDAKNGYAGYKDRPITNIAIQVHTSGSRVFDNYVVMYRAKAQNYGWLPWVSNGWPDIMETLMPGADLDTKSIDAGDGRYGPIQALEIRVYERKGMSGQKPTHAGAYTIDAPYINQEDVNMPNGCESVSTVMALQNIDINISPDTFVDRYLEKGSLHYWNGGVDYRFNPNEVFGGDPRRDDGWGCFAPAIMKALNKFSDSYGFTATNVSGTSLSALCSNYIDKGIPVIMWATKGMDSSYKIHNWTALDGTPVSYNSKLHCLLLIGYDNNNYYFNDPLECRYCPYSKASVEAAYAALGKQAVVVTKTAGSGGTAVAPPKNNIVTKSDEINKKDPLPDEYHADPIDLSTGAHVIDHTIMTVSGAQTLSFAINYHSNIKQKGDVGEGWSHNFEKRVDDKGDEIHVYDSPSYYAVYKKSASDPSEFISDTITKENYTLTKTADGYTVNCNYSSTEYYNASGQLTKITSKSGFNTLLSYTDDAVTVTDEISGRYIILAKDSDGRIVSVTDNTGRTCTLGYIGDQLVSITDENGDILSYQYNENGQIECGRDQNGMIYFTDTYDSSGRIISQKDAIADSATTVINYDEVTDPDYLLVIVTDRSLQTTVYKYNDKKQLVSKTDPNGVELKYEYDDRGNLIRKFDGLGNSAVNTYDVKGNLVSSTDKLGNKTEFIYDARNNLTAIEYPNGGTVTNTYDAKDRLASSTDLRGVVTTYEYNDQNLLIKTSDSDRTVTYTYDKGQPVTVTDPLGRTATKVYNEAGLLMSATDADGNTTSYTYDDKGNVLTVTDPAGNKTAKEYDAGGSLVKSTDAKDNVTTYTHNGNLKMTSMTLPNGAVIRYEYDREDRLVKTVYPDGTAVENTYDAGGRLISTSDRDGNITAYEYDAAGNVVKTTNAEGGVILKEYDAAGNPVKSSEPLTIYDPYYDFDYPEDYDEEDMEWVMSNVTVTTTYEYDNSGRLIKSVNSQGGETVYTYSAAGDLLTVTDPLGNKTTNTYDSFGNLLTVTDPRGNTTSYTYDKLGNLLTVTNALGQVTTNTYDSLNRLISTKDPGGHVVSYEYDALGRMVSGTDAKGNTTTQEYDALGNIVKITNASGHVDYQAVYNSMGKATQVTNAAGSKTINVYDWAGNLTKETDAQGNSSSYTYNGAGQMISAVDKAGNISYATYDGMGNLTSMTGPGGNVKEYVYDSTGRMYRKGSVDTDYKDSYYYNAAGVVETSSDGYGTQTIYTYDAAGRITKLEYGEGTKTYTYDANGNVTSTSDVTGTVKREYDALNRVTKYTDVYGRIISYEYDCCGNLSKMTYYTGEGGVYTYDENHNMLSSGIEGEDLTTTYEYNKQNQVTKIKNIDGGTVTKNYDSAGRLQMMGDRGKDGKFLFTNFFTYDTLGLITSELNPITMIEYRMTYDSLGRLTQRTEYDCRADKAISTESFAYDSAGNILTAELPDGTENTYQYDQDNMISEMNGSQINVDRLGNTTICMINGKNANITYDSRNRLKKIDGDNNEYWYDADNNRINMYYYHTNMQYLYDCSGGRSRLIWTSDHNENVTIYSYGVEGLLWSKCDDEYMIYHYDYRGSVIKVTDIDGNITDTLKYDAYGSVIERTGSSKLIFGYNGQYGVLTDPNGLLYMRTRFYNPQLKRFMNADILDGSIEDSTSLNLYTYVNGNPISFVDPFGLSADRGNNNKNVINDLHWLFNCSYDYFSSYKNEAERIRATNDAVMKFLISERYYNASLLKGAAWDMLAGELDMGYFIYMSQHSNFLSVRESTFYDLDSGEEIDFLHMIATLCACNYESTSGALFTIPSAYAGWAGDLITLAGDVANNIKTEDCDIVKLTKDLMGTGDCSFPKSDLIGDIDAVLINEYMSTMPIDKAFEAYYASDYKDRYSKFFAKEFGGYINNVYSSAEHYLSPGLYNFAFRKAFHSEYSNDIIPYVAQGFTEYFVYEAGR